MKMPAKGGSWLQVLKDMVSTSDHKERIRIYEEANRPPFDFSGMMGDFDLGSIFKGAPK